MDDAERITSEIVWLRMGNSTTDSIAKVLNEKSNALNEFLKDEELGLFEIY
jgi:predicted nuclease of predicted toxin-antitoxin system